MLLLGYINVANISFSAIISSGADGDTTSTSTDHVERQSKVNASQWVFAGAGLVILVVTIVIAAMRRRSSK